MSYTVASIMARYGDDVASIVEEKPAETLADFIEQLHPAGYRLWNARITGFEDLDTAVTYLVDASRSENAAEKQLLLKKATDHLTDMAAEYRLMV